MKNRFQSESDSRPGCGNGNGTDPVLKPATTKQLREIISQQPFFKGLTAAQIQALADSAMEEEFGPGKTILREGDPANRFYLILTGKVVLECEGKDGEAIPVQTLGPGDDLGWSWLFPPYFMLFTARAAERTKVIFFYATPLREKCDEDPLFGCALMKRAAGVVIECLTSTRGELLKRIGGAKN